MCIESTFPSEVHLNADYYGIVDESANFLKDTSILNLVESLKDDIKLRNFFIECTFSSIFSSQKEKGKNTGRYFNDFVKSTGGLIFIEYPHFKEDVIKFFIDMGTHAGKVFRSKIDREFLDVCEKSERLGLLIPKTLIVIEGQAVRFMPSDVYKEGDGDIIGTFYKISTGLFELWVKPDNKGKMLEVWVYNIINNYFKDRNVVIIPNVKLHKHDENTSLSEGTGIVELADKYYRNTSDSLEKYELSELDCVIMKKDGSIDKPIAVIECKMLRDTGWDELIQIYGKMKLLEADFGVLVIGNDYTFKSDLEFEGVKVIHNAISREDFPEVLIVYLDSKLKTMGI